MLLPKCTVCGSKKLRSIKDQDAGRLFLGPNSIHPLKNSYVRCYLLKI